MKNLYGVRLRVEGTMETVVHVPAESMKEAIELAKGLDPGDLDWVDPEPSSDYDPIVIKCQAVKREK